MTWLERVRQKNLAPHTRPTDTTDKSDGAEQKNLEPYNYGTDKTDKSLGVETSVSFGSPPPMGYEVFAEPVETLLVTYQRFSLDYDLRDGTYTPDELRLATLLVKPGPELRYRLRWPGGTPRPMAQREA
jgi:hypothetical protein